MKDLGIRNRRGMDIKGIYLTGIPGYSLIWPLKACLCLEIGSFCRVGGRGS